MRNPDTTAFAVVFHFSEIPKESCRIRKNFALILHCYFYLKS
ncbi:hypothetical protein BSM4216_0596 [Bacillus smithii]|nr:hypothetical protein BSM4216_0596 [Bacillus smithii]